jgi:CRP/FNR family cyclic AMP-dependent transcriptional regulator
MNSSMGKNEINSSSEFEKNLSILREIIFFSKLPLEMLKVLAYLCTRENYKAGDYLFRQNDDDGQAFYIISGVASLLRGDGGQGVVIQEFVANAFLGGLSLLGNSQRLFSLQARTDMTCLILTRQKFDKTMEKFPDNVPRVLQALVDSISSWEKMFLMEAGEGCYICRQKVGVSLL